MKKIKYLLILTLLIAGIIFESNGENDSRLLRFPDINGDLIVFVYAGDIWSVNTSGGVAHRLTSHEGMELFPKISPDGKWIAFSGEYGGNRQVFIIPSEGGKPRQLTWYNPVGVMPPRGGFDNVVLGWTPDSKNVFFRSNRTEFGDRNGKYFTINIEGGMEKPYPIVNGGMATLSPDGKKICFTPVDREFRTWKRYKGGRATDLWIYDLDNNTSEQITTFAGSDQWPVWYNNKIYYASDRDLKLNIYSYDTLSGDTEQLTYFTDMDVLWPSGQNGQLIFENDGYLHKLNLNNGSIERLNIDIHFDNPNRVQYIKNVKEHIHSYAISPTGKRILFDARGDIFSVPAEHGSTVNLTETQGIREIYPSWSPDGKYIAYHSDATGEYEIYLLENSVNSKPKQLTSGSAAWKEEMIWSPNSKYIAYFDRTLQLKLVDVQSGKEVVADRAANSEINDYSFSPDSKWLVYSKEVSNGQPSIWVYNIEDSTPHQLTDHVFRDYSPVFSEDGNYLFFLSNRDFNLNMSSFEFNYIYEDATRIYAVILKDGGPKLKRDKNDVEPVVVDQPDDNNEQDKKDVDSTVEQVNVQIDFEGINDRIVALTNKTGRFRNLVPVEGGLLYLEGGKVVLYDIAEEKSKDTSLEEVSEFTITADKNQILYKSKEEYTLTNIKPEIRPGKSNITLNDMVMKIEPEKEWAQIFNDAWRIFRDFFYVDNLHGVDWEAMKDRYNKWVPYVGHRADLDHILNELVSESNTGHAYVNWGDFKNVDRIDGGLLGALLEADHKTDKYRFAKIYDGENWNSGRRNPLTVSGVDVNEGDFLLAIDGKQITTSDNPYLFLENKAGKRTEITVSSNANGKDPRTSVIEPVNSELELLYITWVNERREMVDKLSNGRIGYIHVPNTAIEGNRELFKGMYAYHDKEALIIDDRYNGGGFIPDVMTRLLERRTLSYWNRGGLSPMRTPGIAHDGPKAMLINGYSSSGGDAFPYFFKKRNLGTLIGSRTWGGLVGISANASLVDGGGISVPRFGIYDEEGQWIIEGVGVYPDIEVIDRPEQLAKGIDPGIEKAVEVLLNQLEENPVRKTKSPQSPNRSGWIEYEID